MTEVIRLDQVSLWRRTQEEFSYDLKKTVLSLVEGKYRKPARKLVLDRIDLAVKSGEKVGIIGANGSGKSTLLKVISGILKPTSGQVRVRGQIAPLIELGAGFDVDLSVMDNILLYGVLLGFSRKEMKHRARSILEFAELEEYASVPVKALSSGMVARLGFAIATDVQPDILILDEVLSVGDESFKNKCKQRMEKFWEDNATILVVSHDLKLVQQACHRVIWLDKGRIRFSGNADESVEFYLDTVRPVFATVITLPETLNPVIEESVPEQELTTPTDSVEESVLEQELTTSTDSVEESVLEQELTTPTDSVEESVLKQELTTPTDSVEESVLEQELTTSTDSVEEGIPEQELATITNSIHTLPALTPRPRVLTALPGSGLHWLKNIISQVMGQVALERRLQDPSALISALNFEASKHLLYEHFDYDLHCSILTPAKYPDLRMILLYRNPLDALIANFYLRASTKTLPDNTLSPLKSLKLYIRGYWNDKLLPDSLRTTMLFNMSLRDYVRRCIIGWYKSGYCLPIRYEDLVEDIQYQPTILRLILNYLDVQHLPETIAEVIRSNSLDMLSTAYYHNPDSSSLSYWIDSSGQWRQVFDREDLEILNAQIGDYLELLGYPLDKFLQ